MNEVSEVRISGQPTRRHLLVVTTFIVAASLLVVLTTFAINLLTATGDLNRLLVRWSQNNSESVSMALSYLADGEQESLQEYRDFTEKRMYTGDVISELMSESPDKNLIFREFDPEDIHPNEITGLIRIFSLFGQTQEIKDIEKTWASVLRLSLEKNHLIDSLITVSNTSEIAYPSAEKIIQSKDMEINSHIREMVLDNSGILLLLKSYSLWFTVLLGILIVLIGVIYTVRGMKSIRNTQELLAERDYLAKFPELNQFPVLNISVQGDVDFVNQATQNLFPNLTELGLSHAFLAKVESSLTEITHELEKTMLFEVQVGDKYYQQVTHYLSAKKGIHIHSIDITELKNKQLQLSRTLDEKETLLAEVHHRVKNNMAVITGLLELQEMMGQDPASALSESRARIKSMAIIHELLYESNSFSDINIQEYLTELSKHFSLSIPNIVSIEVQNSTSTSSLNINQALPLALLLNELAFYLSQEAENMNRKLELKLQILPINNMLCLQVTSPIPVVNNPLNANSTEEPTLRMSLIENLLAQIEGDLNIPPNGDLLIEIQFNPNKKKGSSSTLV